MDKLDSVTPENSSISKDHLHNGVNTVASLVSALLDDVTVLKNAELLANTSREPLPIAAENSYHAATDKTSYGTLQPSTANATAAQTPATQPTIVSFPHGSHEAAFPKNGHNPAEKPVENLLSQSYVPQVENVSRAEDSSHPFSTAPTAFLQPSTTPVEESTHTQQPPTQPEQGTESEPYQSDGMAINIKGRADGVIIEIGRGNWEILVEALRRRLDQAGGFFRGGNVALDLADRSLQESDLRMICDVLVAHNMKPALVRTASDRTFQSALMLGLAGTLESMDGRPLETVHAAPSNQESQTHYVYRGALRSGQVLKRRSHVLIIGDVNPGSEVIATGDILIWGRLRGVAHAGVEGDTRAIVAAFDIDPVQLRIADTVAVGSGAQSESGYRWVWSRNADKRPEIARIVNGQIAIEPWDEAKTGGSPVLKKRR